MTSKPFSILFVLAVTPMDKQDFMSWKLQHKLKTMKVRQGP